MHLTGKWGHQFGKNLMYSADFYLRSECASVICLYTGFKGESPVLYPSTRCLFPLSL